MRTWDHACINSRVEVHVRCVEGALEYLLHSHVGHLGVPWPWII